MSKCLLLLVLALMASGSSDALSAPAVGKPVESMTPTLDQATRSEHDGEWDLLVADSSEPTFREERGISHSSASMKETFYRMMSGFKKSFRFSNPFKKVQNAKLVKALRSRISAVISRIKNIFSRAPRVAEAHQSEHRVPLIAEAHQSEHRVPLIAEAHQSEHRVPLIAEAHRSDHRVPLIAEAHQSDHRVPKRAASHQSDHRAPRIAEAHQSDHRVPKRVASHQSGVREPKKATAKQFDVMVDRAKSLIAAKTATHDVLFKNHIEPKHYESALGLRPPLASDPPAMILEQIDERLKYEAYKNFYEDAMISWQ